MKKKIFTLSVIFIFCFAFCLAFIFSKKAKEPDYDFALWNGTGEEIQAIEIQSKKDNIACSIEKISIPDKGHFGFKLPDNMKYKDEYQIIIKYGNRRAKVKKAQISTDGSSQYLLTIKGKESSIPLAVGVTAGGLAVGGIATTARASVAGAPWAMIVFNTTGPGIGALIGTLAWIGSLFGGGVATGVGIVSAIPVAGAIGALAITKMLQADKLIVTPLRITDEK